MIEVILYSRENCSLCKEAESILRELNTQFPHSLTIVDINLEPVLMERYGNKIPVVEIGPYHLDAPFDRQQLMMTLSAAIDRNELAGDRRSNISQGTSSKSDTITRADNISVWFTKHYMLLFNFFILVYVGLPFLAPILMKTGVTGPATLIYRAYSFMCHQLAFRSYFLYGEQIEYPRQAAGLQGLLTYEQSTGFNSNDFYTARNFLGNENLGYKVALCERDIAIYGGILLFGMVFSLSNRRIPVLSWGLWILLGIVPIAIDGGSQLVSQLPISFINHIILYRESTPLLRTITGGLFGIMTAWFAYPLVELSMKDTQKMLAIKYSRVRKNLITDK